MFNIRHKSTQSGAHIMRSLNLSGIYSRQMDPRIWHKVAALSGTLYSPSKWVLRFLPLNAKFVCQTGISALCLGTYGAHVYKPQNPAFKEVFLLWVNVFTLSSMKRGASSRISCRFYDVGRSGKLRLFIIWFTLPPCLVPPLSNTLTLCVACIFYLLHLSFIFFIFIFCEIS